ncbi:hypothetical protein M0804_011723 [Polistes exclamans]|nr:hypothetical protein M0804_011723 [Polistes exclamans]
MERYEEEADDSDNETDPEQLLNEWLGELDSLTVGFTVTESDTKGRKEGRCDERAFALALGVASEVGQGGRAQIDNMATRNG